MVALAHVEEVHLEDHIRQLRRDRTRSFAANLRRIRESRGITKYRLWQLTGISEAALSRYESGQRYAQASHMALLAGALDCAVDDLTRETTSDTE